MNKPVEFLPGTPAALADLELPAGAFDFLQLVAAEHCHVETLEKRGRDALDFHDIGVAGLRRALAAAFNAGRVVGRTEQID